MPSLITALPQIAVVLHRVQYIGQKTIRELPFLSSALNDYFWRDKNLFT